ncbi:putative atp dependent rna helicase protein [Botrytis fragariae]|uniref:ATP-dependent RNA helicase n=1 Tax=Botrytis fragariae TaxID=1964551 RepID=A0A8H6AS34_9HELO|nr:putative atp dependent rna helicase protein [Botrytis fragariae]KAF5872464.1 putative atp dependent rna helicase protein [Botrytis fragariae]
MADDGMLMNFEIGDVPIVAKQAFKGGRWKDRLAAKKTAQHRVTKSTNKPSAREIFSEPQHDTSAEEYIGRGASSRAPKRQRVDDNYNSYGGRNENTAAYASGKLPSGTINVGGGRKTTFQEEPRTAFVAGKLPPGSINIGGKKATQIEDEGRAAYASGKLPPGSINSGAKKAISFQDETRPAYVSGKLPHGSLDGMRNREMAAVHREIAEGGRKPGQVVSSLFTFNPTSKKTFEESEEQAEPAKPSNAPLTEEMATFTNLGLSRRLAAHLSTKLDMKAPTAIQKASVQQLISDDSDAFIQAETGSGKTLAYLLPIVERILALSENGVQIHRDSGLFAIILSPTRELCKQIAAVLEKVLRCAPWIVGTTVNGGESKQSEKARLRKGVNILVATPGRLADHLDNTEVLNVATVRWLVLDEGDRLMELGFEEEIKGIVEKIGRRSVAKANSDMGSLPKRRVTILCSATMKMNVQRLGEISLKDAVHIQADPSEQDKQDKENGIEAQDKAFSAPTQLKQSYAIVPAKLRLVTLTALLKRAFARKGSVMKAIVFISCADSVDFHFSLFSRTPEASAEVADEEKIDLPALPKSELVKETIAHGTTISNNSNPVILHKLHGSLAQNIRTATLKAFSESTDPCVMICTDVASRGLDLPNVDFVIEYDPPFSAEDHLHRVGRTARAGREGRALIFLMPGVEEEYVSILASGYREGKKALTRHTAEDLIQKGFGGIGREWEERATNFQLEVERWSLDSPKYLEMARRGYQSHIRAYATHVANERHIFNMQELHLGHLAKAFALRDKPGSIKVPGLRPSKMTKADRSVAARKAKRGEKAEDKAPEGERVRKQKKMELDLPTVDGNEAAARMKRKMKEHMAAASEFNIG